MNFSTPTHGARSSPGARHDVDVVGLGCCCFDLLGVVPHLPGPDEEIRMLETRQQGGGEVATALVTLARFGVLGGLRRQGW